jgi:hypothetical protein
MHLHVINDGVIAVGAFIFDLNSPGFLAVEW